MFDRFLSRSGPTSHITLHTAGERLLVAAPNTNSLNLPGGSPSDEIELIMTDSNPFPNGQETRTFVQQSRKISQNSTNSTNNTNSATTEKVTRPGSRSPDNNDTQEWVSAIFQFLSEPSKTEIGTLSN